MNNFSRPSTSQYVGNYAFNQHSRFSTKHSTITALTDQSLIAFEIEHERKRLREELDRLKSAQSDAQRSLQILQFMSTHIGTDPLVDPSINPLSQHRQTNQSNAYTPHTTQTHSQSQPQSHPPMLEYLPSNTIIRCANKALKKISDIKVGHKILSLCINTYPNHTNENNNTQKRNSYLPKPTKRQSQISANHKNNINNSADQSKKRQSQHISYDGYTNSTDKQRDRKRSHTAVITAPAFMLPPPSYANANANANANNTKDKPRMSMPMINGAINSNSSPNLIEQSVTNVVQNSPLMLTPHGSKSPVKSPVTHKNRRKTESAIHFRGNESPYDSIQYSQITHNNKMRQNGQRKGRQSYSNSGNCQIPGPMPQRKHAQTHLKSSSKSNPWMKHKSLSRGNSPKGGKNGYHFGFSQNGHRNNGQSNNGKKTRFSSNDMNGNGNEHRSNGHRTQRKKARFSTNDARKSMKKDGRSNYLEPVSVMNVVESTIYQLIEIITENDFKIRCTPTHLFWICGKGWGCFDSKKRIQLESAILAKRNRTKTRVSHIIHELKRGEQLLSVGGNKYRISYINVIDKPKGTHVYALTVNKNDCFFANDLLVKNSIA